MIANYEVMFGSKPTKYSAPKIAMAHPELDTTPEFDENGIKRYQSLIGALQWLVTLGCFDILIAVTTMSGYRIALREGHLERFKQIIGYVKKHCGGAICSCTNIPGYESCHTPKKFDWSSSVYGNVQEDVPHDMPVPKFRVVCPTTYQDANLFHNLVTGRSMTGILLMLNQTPIHWFSKRQGRVQSATYVYEFMAARTALNILLIFVTLSV
jgi:hypothetical protein